MTDRRPRRALISGRRTLRRAAAVVATTLVLMGSAATVASSQFNAATSATPIVTTLVIGNPSGAAASTSILNACVSVKVTWAAATNADSYRVQVQVDGGPWTDLFVETANVTQVTDSTVRIALSVRYRIYGRDAGSNWEGPVPSVTAPVSLTTCV